MTGPRKRKKRVRYGDEDFDNENAPPTSIVKTEKESIFIKAEAQIHDCGTLVLGKTPLGSSNVAETEQRSSPVMDTAPPMAEAEVSLAELRLLHSDQASAP